MVLGVAIVVLGVAIVVLGVAIVVLGVAIVVLGVAIVVLGVAIVVLGVAIVVLGVAIVVLGVAIVVLGVAIVVLGVAGMLLATFDVFFAVPYIRFCTSNVIGTKSANRIHSRCSILSNPRRIVADDELSTHDDMRFGVDTEHISFTHGCRIAVNPCGAIKRIFQPDYF